MAMDKEWLEMADEHKFKKPIKKAKSEEINYDKIVLDKWYHSAELLHHLVQECPAFFLLRRAYMVGKGWDGQFVKWCKACNNIKLRGHKCRQM